MKCDELKDYDYDPDFPFQSRGRFYVADEVDAAIAELKQKLQDQCISCPFKMQEDDVVAEKDNEIRRLKRALWLARATIAHNAIYKYQRLAYKAEMDPQPHEWSCYINGEVYRTGKMNRMLEPYYWTEIWKNVEHKCLKKAEEYK